LSTETSCWLFIAAQHTHAEGSFYHYTSPRLLREGKSDIEDITNQFNKLFAKIQAARLTDALAMHKRLQEAEGKTAEAEEKVASTSRALATTVGELERVTSDLEAQERLIEHQNAQLEQFKAMLGGSLFQGST
jgi:phage-related tail protein